MSARKPVDRCAFCEHPMSKHGALGCTHSFPILGQYGRAEGQPVGTRGCLCQLTRAELRDGVDIAVLKTIRAEQKQETAP